MIAEIETELQPVHPGKESLAGRRAHDREAQLFTATPPVCAAKPCEVLQCLRATEGERSSPTRGQSRGLPSSASSRHP